VENACLERFTMAGAGEADDSTLVARFKRSKDPDWFAELFDRHGRRLYALAWRAHENREKAEDCVQETFRRAIENIHRFDETATGSSFWGWLVTIARHVCLDEFRRAAFRQAAADQLLQHSNGQRKLTPLEETMLQELHAELGQLETEYRLCFLLSQVVGYSYHEIMQQTGYTEKQVKTYIQTARRHIERRFR
jgi:RNA polymerase sigma-70 factor, ECF subfamily